MNNYKEKIFRLELALKKNLLLKKFLPKRLILLQLVQQKLEMQY